MKKFNTKTIEKFLYGAGLFVALGLGKGVKAQVAPQSTTPKRVVKENTQGMDTDSVQSEKGKLIQFAEAKDCFYIKPQFFGYTSVPNGVNFVGIPEFGLKPTLDLFDGKASVGFGSTCWLTNYVTKEVTPLIGDFQGHANVRVGKDKSIKAQYGKFCAFNYCAEASNCIPLGVEFLNVLELKSGFYFPMAAMVSFHDKNWSVGLGMGSGTQLKWQGERNIFVSGEYKCKFFNGELELNLGTVLAYNTGTFGESYQIGGNLKDKLSGTVQFKMTTKEGSATLFEMTGFGAQKELSWHLMWFYNTSSVVPNTAFSFDVYMHESGELTEYRGGAGGAWTLWNTKRGAYVSLGYGTSDPTLIGYQFYGDGKGGCNVEAGIKTTPLEIGRLIGLCH